MTNIQRRLVGFVFLADWQTLAKAWRPPFLNFAEVQQKLMGTLVHETLTSILKDSHAKFQIVWDP